MSAVNDIGQKPSLTTSISMYGRVGYGAIATVSFTVSDVVDRAVQSASPHRDVHNHTIDTVLSRIESV